MHVPTEKAATSQRATRDVALLLQIFVELNFEAKEGMLRDAADALARQKLKKSEDKSDIEAQVGAASLFLDKLARETFHSNAGTLVKVIDRMEWVIDGEYDLPDYFLGDSPSDEVLRLGINCTEAAENFYEAYRFLIDGAVNGYQLDSMKEMLGISVQPDWKTDPADKMKMTFDKKEHEAQVLESCLETLEDSIQAWRSAFFERLINTPNQSVDWVMKSNGDLD